MRPVNALISMGVYVFKTSVLIESLRNNCEERSRYDFGHHVIPSLVSSARVYAYDFRDECNDAPRYWRDIGTIDSYYQANMDIVRPDSGFSPYINQYDASHVTVHPATLHTEYGSRARVHTDCCVSQTVVSPGVRIEEGAKICRSIIMAGAHIGRGAAIRNAIIEQDVHLPEGIRIGWDANLDRQRFPVSPAGVVVVSETPENQKTILCPSFESAMHRDSMRVVA